MYEKTTWLNHATQPENCFSVTDNADGTKTIVRAGTVLQQGTPVSAANLNKMEDGILAATQLAEAASRTQPYVGVNGNWYVWDANLGAYKDTGISATGPEGPAGPAGPATIEIDSTSVGSPAVENVGTSQNAKLKFTLPAATGTGVSLADAGGFFPDKNAEAALQQIGGGWNWRKTTGNPVRVYPVPASPLAVKALLTATQAGSGDPSPDNIRAISPAVAAGGTVKAKRTGKNLAEVITPAFINANAEYVFSSSVAGTTSAIAKVVPGMMYVGQNIGGDRNVCAFYDRYPTAGLIPLSHYDSVAGGVVAPSNAMYMVWYIANVGTLVSNVQIELGFVTTPYEPYVGNDYTLTVQQDLYGIPGGASDVIANDGSETHKAVVRTFLGTEAWEYYLENQPTDTTLARFRFPLTNMTLSSIAITNQFPYYNEPNYDTTIEMACGHSSAHVLSIYIKKSRLTGWSDGWTDGQKIAAFEAWLATQNTAGTPLQVLYQPEVPTTLTAGTPVAIPALAAVEKYAERMNVVTLDKGTAEVGFAEHPNRDFVRLTEKTGYGVVSGLGVTAQSTPDMTVKVAPGIIYLPSGERYDLLGAAALAGAVADPTNPRIDIVYVSASGVVTYLAGTAAMTPSAPALPTGGVLLAQIAVAAWATTIQTANISARKKGLWTEDWITPTLLNGWLVASWYKVQYRKDNTGRVHLRGRLTEGTLSSIIFVLPAGYRPAYAITTPVWAGASALRLVIESNGNVSSIGWGGAGAWGNIDNVAFYGEV